MKGGDVEKVGGIPIVWRREIGFNLSAQTRDIETNSGWLNLIFSPNFAIPSLKPYTCARAGGLSLY